VLHASAGVRPLLVVAGSGKKGVKTMNVSTPSCLVAASAGARVIKVGSAATSSILGSRDLVRGLAIPEAGKPEDALASVQRHGFAFVSIEDRIPQIDRIYGGRFHATNPFSFALPALACPIQGALLVYGLSHPRVDISARVLARFGVRDAVILTSRTAEGFYTDEVGIGVESLICEIRDGNAGSIEPLSAVARLRWHVDRAPLHAPSTPAEAHAWAIEALSGRGRQSHMEIVALNAGYLMVLAGISPSLEQGYNDARQVIRNGLALKKINDIRAENEEEKDPGWES
jgi:anthranilate phosphoribosyltransferase